MRNVRKRRSWKKILTITLITLATLSLAGIVASYPETQRVKRAQILQEKCESAKTNMALRKTEFETQSKNFYANNKIEMESIQNALNGISGATSSLGYGDNAARIGAIGQLNNVDTRTSELTRSVNDFKAKSDAEAASLNAIQQTIYDCAADDVQTFNEVKTEKYKDAINKSKQQVQLQP